jgi:hypothetical protein
MHRALNVYVSDLAQCAFVLLSVDDVPQASWTDEHSSGIPQIVPPPQTNIIQQII